MRFITVKTSLRRRMIAALTIAMCGVLALAPAGADAGDISAAEAGARYGQAMAGAKFCPGGKVTAKAEAIRASFSGDNTAIFTAEAEKVTVAWDKAFACVEVDPNNHRTTQCRKLRLASCRQAWIEIGTEGRNMPGLLDVDFGAWAEKHPGPP